MDIKDCGIKTPGELSIRHSDISVGKGVTGKSAPPYETTQCSARTEFSVLAPPLPFSYFSAVLHLRTSICTTGARRHSDVSRMPAQFPARPLASLLRAGCFPPHCAHPLAVSHTTAHCARPFIARPLTAHARSPHARSLFPARPFAVFRASPPPRASTSTSRFLLRLAGKAEPGAERDKDRL
ncbi:hypothetical protein B0H13DRAFT_2344960 [Mycena leptocephala]|nr:hypothetical protein B0H13DRAFT_2344960 [Mycena leptocephala]